MQYEMQYEIQYEIQYDVIYEIKYVLKYLALAASLGSLTIVFQKLFPSRCDCCFNTLSSSKLIYPRCTVELIPGALTDQTVGCSTKKGIGNFPASLSLQLLVCDVHELGLQDGQTSNDSPCKGF